MARQEVVTFVDDIDGSEAKGTVGFSLDTTAYEIDLSEANETKLREALAPYLEVARKKAQTLSRAKAAASTRSTQDREELRKVRQWAKENGYTVNERGRIPGKILDAYYSGRPAQADSTKAMFTGTKNEDQALFLLSSGPMKTEGPAKATMNKAEEFTKWAQSILEEHSEMPLKDIEALDYGKLQDALKDRA